MTEKEKEKEEEKEEVEEVYRRPRRRGHRGSGIVWAFILLFLGAVFLLNNFNLLPWSIWSQLWRLWPLILIFTAVQIIFGRSFIGRFIVSIFVFGILSLIFIFAVFPKDNEIRRGIEVQFPSLGKISLPSFESGERVTKTLRVEAERYEDEKIDERSVDFDLGSSRLNISDSDMVDFLVIDATYFEGVGEPVVESDLDNGVLKLHFYTKDTQRLPFGTAGKRTYDATLGRLDIVTDLNINQGSGQTDVDLSSLVLNLLGVKMGSGSINVDLSSMSTPSKSITIDMGSGSMKLILPEGTGIKTDYIIGSGSLKIEGNSLSGNGTYTSSNYFTAETKVEIDLKMGSGSVNITSD